MIRGLYTGASGMVAQMSRLDVVANNLANVDKTAFKADHAVFKSFPELLIRRLKDDGVKELPIGSYDMAPMVGTMGTGVEVNDVFTDFSQGNNFKRTEIDTDLALTGKGFMVVETGEGTGAFPAQPHETSNLRFTRNGNFLIDKEGFLVTKDGFKILGENGHIQIKHGNFKIDEDGVIWENSNYDARDLGTFVDRQRNEWANMQPVDRLLVVNFYDNRELVKEGNSFYRATGYAGEPVIMQVGKGRPKIMQGYLETSNVSPITEMVRMIETHRTYEACHETVKIADGVLGKIVNEVGRA